MQEKISYEMVEQAFVEEMQQITDQIASLKNYEAEIIRKSYDDSEYIMQIQENGLLDKSIASLNGSKTLLQKIKNMKNERSKDPLHYLQKFNKILREEINTLYEVHNSIKEEMQLFSQTHANIIEEQFSHLSSLKQIENHYYHSFVKENFNPELISTTEDKLWKLKETFHKHMVNKENEINHRAALKNSQEKEIRYLQSIYKDRKNINL